MNRNLWGKRAMALVAGLALWYAPWSLATTGYAGDEKSKAQAAEKGQAKEKDGGLAVKDLPGPIPDVLEGIKNIGNAVGKEISKGTAAAAGAVKKTIESNKKDEDK
ncbi:MAG: hypothetical protein ACREI3_06010 [Nitrospirales bacterium]